MTDNHDLESQIAETRQTISSDSYPMSIGELTNLYREGELNVRPEFQRFFRWSSLQKSRLVESILLGIPIPSIFVSQAASGTWELVDGLQRVSTILELQGLLQGKDGELLDPLVLQGTKYLPGLEGRKWEDPDPIRSLSTPQRLDVKRSKLDIKIIQRESSPGAKYDLFQRLNSYGMSFTAQEMRSALLLSVSPEYFSWTERLSSYQNYVSTLALSDRLVDEKYDLELLLRWLVLHDRPAAELTQQKLRDFSVFLDDNAIAMAEKFPVGSKKMENTFHQTFDLLGALGENVFRKWDPNRSEFRGSFLNTAFEVIAMGLGFHIANGTPFRTDH